MAEEKSNCIPPKVYAIWADAKPDGPMNGQSGFLSEGEHRLFFASQEDADLKICDLKNLCLNRISATEYQSVEYPGGHDPMASVRAEDVKAYDLRLGPEPIRYEITQRIYGNTGGGCMVGTLALRLPELDKTVWVNCNDEGVTITSADCIWNEDHSDSWNRYEDVVMFEIDFREDAPESIWPLLPAIQEAIAYTIGQETDYSGTPFRIPARWLPESYRQQADPQFLKWALEQNKDIRIGKGGILHPDKEFIRNNLGQLVYIASPLSGDVEQNLHFARQACRYAISQGLIPFAPHLLYTQMLDDGSPSERQLGIDMGNRMLELCDELWLCGDQISTGMAGEKGLAEALGIPVRSVSTEEILSVDISPTKGMGLSMG